MLLDPLSVRIRISEEYVSDMICMYRVTTWSQYHLTEHAVGYYELVNHNLQFLTI